MQASSSDILTAWKHLFHSSWKTFRTQFQYILNSLRRHKNLVESQAGLVAVMESQRARAVAEKHFEEDEKAERSRRSIAVIEKIRPPNCQVDQDCAAETRHESQTGQWILQHKQVKDWMNSQSTMNPLLWLNGIPGAGKLLCSTFSQRQSHVRQVKPYWFP